MDTNLLIIGGLIFLAGFLGLEGAVIWWNSKHGAEAKNITRRLNHLSSGGVMESETSVMYKQRLLTNNTGLSKWLLKFPRFEQLEHTLIQSGLHTTVSAIVAISVGLGAVVFLGTLTARLPIWFALGFGIAASLVPLQYVLFARGRRLSKFETLLPEALDLIGRSLRAGHAFPSAIQMVGSEMPAPVGPEFQLAFDEINFGVDSQAAMQNLARRVPITDLRFFVIAVLIQRETGGNLSEVLDNISSIIRDRLKLFGRIKALSAEGRYSAMILIALPFATLALLYTVNRDMTSLLWTDPAGINIIYFTLASMFFGTMWIRKIIKIRV